MMRNGFIFSYEMCVGCKACSAACMLENGWNFKSRNIYSSNTGCFSPDPVITLSMACNHCSDPVCLKGCPSGAFSKNSITGAVIIDSAKCLGCRYCIWNCPYDAPKFNNSEGVIEKCHFCNHRIEEGIEPACSSSCPTGALAFGEIPEVVTNNNISWIPDKNINPALLIKGSEKYSGPVIISAEKFTESRLQATITEEKMSEWSLFGFTFLTIVSVALSVSALFTEAKENVYVGIGLVTLAAILSVFHLGSKMKAWRALGNLKSSPLSREIGLFILYSALVILNQVIRQPYIGIITSLAGILLVMAIDSVYSFTAGKRALFLHSGQAFLTLMLMVSFFLNIVPAFIFIALIKMVLSISKIKAENRNYLSGIRFIRLAFLLITVLIMIRGSERESLNTLIIVFSGEITDRFIFYVDFRPLNIKNTLI